MTSGRRLLVIAVPGTGAMIAGVRGSPLPAVIFADTVHSLSSVPLQPSQKLPRRASIPVVYWTCTCAIWR